MTIKVNIEFSADETNKESMKTLACFFRSFEEHIEVTASSIKTNPFVESTDADSEKRVEPDNWFISENQANRIAEYLKADKNDHTIDGYERKFKKEYPISKRVHMMTRSERDDIHMACKCIANEVLSGGIVMVGKAYINGLKASLCVKDHNSVFHEISFTRMFNGKPLNIDQVDRLVSEYMISVGVGSRYCKGYDTSYRNKTSISLPSDVKPESEQE